MPIKMIIQITMLNHTADPDSSGANMRANQVIKSGVIWPMVGIAAILCWARYCLMSPRYGWQKVISSAMTIAASVTANLIPGDRSVVSTPTATPASTEAVIRIIGGVGTGVIRDRISL